MSPLAGAKRALAWGLLKSGLLAVSARRASRKAIILVYHRVNDEPDPFFPSLPSPDFQRQVELVARRYRVQTLEEVAEWLRAGAPGAPRVALTVDDGFPDTAQVVAPILQRLGVPATLFLATQPPEENRPIWIEEVRWTFKHASAGPLPARADRLRELEATLRRMKALSPGEVDAETQRLREELRPEGPPPGLLSWSDVSRLAAGIFHLGGHTHAHYMVSHLDDSRLEEEITGARRLITERTGQPVRTFAYPNGESADYDRRAIAVLQKHGFTCAVTCRHGRAQPEDDPFELPRLATYERYLPLFAARLTGLGREDATNREVA
jgi:peptidoglycan/xylan/chitin deacetylase (PgdA/CDA1 family)